MRIDGSAEVSAEAIVNDTPEEDLADLIYSYGEERYSRRIAAAIYRNRAKARIRSTTELAEIIRRAVPRQYRYGRIHPATRTFQAIRIAVNDELGHIERALPRSFDLLSPGGRIAVISFHSLEDRIVKRFFKEKNKSCTCPPESPMCKCGDKKEAILLTKKPLEPRQSEIASNSPSRSAKLRVIQKVPDEELRI